MNHFLVTTLSALSILVPAFACVARFGRLGERYRPLAILIWAGVLNEALSYLLIQAHGNNMLNANLYSLVECLLLLFFFYRWGRRYPPFVYSILAACMVAAWVLDNLVLHRVTSDNIVSDLFAFLMIVVISMDHIGYLMIQAPGSRAHRSEILLLAAFLLYYSYQAFISLFLLFPIGASPAFYTTLWLILSIVNMLVNLIIALSVLWIPTHRVYT
ncbi:MAG: hypothetical protein V4450_00720 [Bacteroidota bacterium]